jgi:hypothetical protein
MNFGSFAGFSSQLSQNRTLMWQLIQLHSGDFSTWRSNAARRRLKSAKRRFLARLRIPGWMSRSLLRAQQMHACELFVAAR